MNENISVALLIFTVVIFLLALANAMNKKENFKQCICGDRQGGREQNCQDTVDVNNLYVTGQLTETSDLKSRGWSTVSPGDINFPASNGCVPIDRSNKQWQSWDFTEFGN